MAGEAKGRVARFESWFAMADAGETFIYFRGESLAAAKVGNAALADFAERMLQECAGRFNVVSRCGHIRSEIIGAGNIELTTKREQGENVYMARKLQKR